MIIVFILYSKVSFISRLFKFASFLEDGKAFL